MAVVAFSVPACYVAGQDKCNCSNFTTHAWAQWFHDTYDPSDVNKLDADNDGLVSVASTICVRAPASL